MVRMPPFLLGLTVLFWGWEVGWLPLGAIGAVVLELPRLIRWRWDFSEADMSNSDLQNTDFENSRFYNTNLSGADFRGARNFYIDTKNNILIKARFSFAEAMTLLNCLDIIIE